MVIYNVIIKTVNKAKEYITYKTHLNYLSYSNEEFFAQACKGYNRYKINYTYNIYNIYNMHSMTRVLEIQ